MMLPFLFLKFDLTFLVVKLIRVSFTHGGKFQHYPILFDVKNSLDCSFVFQWNNSLVLTTISESAGLTITKEELSTVETGIL